MVSIMKNIEKDFENISPKEFLDFACELNQIKEDLNSTNSAINRTIYMRIYYAVFLFLREWLKKFMNYESRKGEHIKLPRFVRKHGPFSDKKNKEIYRDLNLLKKLRHQADYKLSVPPKDSSDYQKWEFTSITSAFEIAEGIIKTFNDYKSF